MNRIDKAPALSSESPGRCVWNRQLENKKALSARSYGIEEKLGDLGKNLGGWSVRVLQSKWFVRPL